MKKIGIFILVCGVITLVLSAVFLVYGLVQGAEVALGPGSDFAGLLIGCLLIAFGVTFLKDKK